MGLISKEVEVVLNGSNIKYYESLGYEIPRRKSKWGRVTVPSGTKKKIKIEYLQKNSNVKVKVKCDNPNCGKEYEIGYYNYIKRNHNGKIYCKDCANTVLLSGENHWNYNPNLTQEERENGRNYPKYIEFIKKVLARDNYTCQVCGKESHGNAEVHHLDSYDWCVDKRTDETNGICLCHNCHYNFHLIYGRGNNTKEQFEEWLGKSVELLKYNEELPTARKIYCIEEDKTYNGAYELANEWNCCVSQIYSVCDHKYKYKSIKSKHLLWFDEYEKMTKEEILKIEKNNKQFVICLTTKNIFNYISKAKEFYNIKSNHIASCCKGIRKSCGKLKDGTPLEWKYIDDLTEEEYIKYDIENKLKELNKEEI